MTRPNIIRADTLDLQDHDQPSAQAHRHPQHTALNGTIAPHQETELRHVQQERHAEQDYMADQWGSGRSSHEGSELLEEDSEFLLDNGPDPHDPRHNGVAVQQNGSHTTDQQNTEVVDQDGDEDLDDDGVDKISSSPSIEDGQYSALRTQSIISRPDMPIIPHLADVKVAAPPAFRFPSFSQQRRRRNHLRDASDEQSGLLLTAALRESQIVDDIIPPSPTVRSLSIVDAFADSGRFPWRSLSNMSLGESIDLDGDAGDSDEEDEDDADTADEINAPEQDIQFELPSDPEHLDHGWGSSSLQNIEDIDFEFVYALHTFVATVEGQANATKGDTMVLLDDSNSYWWLVRVVKDSSIGYLPAEHIETPTERLARLNKHRNIDLAQTMLGDNPERSKNPLKKAMRRRNAKMVQFTAPVYFEPAEVDWSDEEEGDADDNIESVEQNGNNAVHHDQHDGDEDETHAETAIQDQDVAQAEHVERAELDATAPAKEVKEPSEIRDAHEEVTELGDGAAVKGGVTRNGTIRNTDSFFKDETAEPRKISLTPGLLREDSGGVARVSESTDKSSAMSLLEELEKTPSIESMKSDKSKDSKAKKEKKSGKFSGLFKRKDKKIKVDEAAGGTVSKPEEVPLSPSAPTSVEGSAAVSPTSSVAPAPLNTKTSRGKLTKPPPASAQQAAQAAQLSQDANTSSASYDQPKELTLQIPEDETKRDKGVLSPLAKVLSPSSPDQPKKEKLKKAKTRMALDVDSSPENELADDFIEPSRQAGTNFITPGRPAPAPPNRMAGQGVFAPRQDPSLIQSQQATDLSQTPHQQQEAQSSFVFQPRHNEDSSQSTMPYSESGEAHDVSTAATTPADNDRRMSWDPIALRTYLDERGTQDIKDMLYIIQDHTDTEPVGMDHPIMVESGFAETQKRLEALSTQLDNLLFQFMASRNMLAPSRKPSIVR